MLHLNHVFRMYGLVDGLVYKVDGLVDKALRKAAGRCMVANFLDILHIK